MKPIILTEKTRNTPKLRLRIYEAMLEYILNYKKTPCRLEYPYGLCRAYLESILIRRTCTDDYKHAWGNMNGVMVEIMEYEPEEYEIFMYWFPLDKAGLRKRIRILKKIITKMKSN